MMRTLTLSRGAEELLSRVRETLDSPDSRANNSYYEITEAESRAAEQLVLAGLAFYAGDRGHLGLYRQQVSV